MPAPGLFPVLQDSVLEDGAVVSASRVIGTTVAAGAVAGPFACLRAQNPEA